MSDQTRMVAEALRGCSTVLLTVHKNPDGDALGSQLGLMLALEKAGFTVSAHNLDPVPEIYRYLPGAGRITSGPAVQGSYDAMIVLDCEPSRTALFDGTYPARVLINLDHHVTNPLEWKLTWLDTHAAATGEMVYALVLHMGIAIDRDIALNLYTSIFTDTGSFRYTNTTPESMTIAAELIKHGVDPWQVTEQVYESYAYRRLKLLGMVLADMDRTADGRIAWVVVTDELYRMTGTTAEDTDNFINFVRSVKGVEVAFLLRQTADNQYKISLRSKGRVDLSSLAQSFGGGGHRNAAGATIDGTLANVLDRVIKAVTKLMDEQNGAQRA